MCHTRGMAKVRESRLALWLVLLCAWAQKFENHYSVQSTEALPDMRNCNKSENITFWAAGISVNLPRHADSVSSLFASQSSFLLAERMCNRDVACVLESCIEMASCSISFSFSHLAVRQYLLYHVFLFRYPWQVVCVPSEEGTLTLVWRFKTRAEASLGWVRTTAEVFFSIEY